MVLNILPNRLISEVQNEFNHMYPFLKIEFYQNNLKTITPTERRRLQNTVSFKTAGLEQDGKLELSDETTVGKLENCFRNTFGLSVQVSRKSGKLWLETTMTDKWTLKQQNDRGRELSESFDLLH